MALPVGNTRAFTLSEKPLNLARFTSVDFRYIHPDGKTRGY